MQSELRLIPEQVHGGTNPTYQDSNPYKPQQPGLSPQRFVMASAGSHFLICMAMTSP
jgi:hypothetical protein